MSSLADSELIARLRNADGKVRSHYPGEPSPAQPVHTVYVNADDFSASTPATLHAQARAALSWYGASPGGFAHAIGLPGFEAAPEPAHESADADALQRDPDGVQGRAPQVWLAHQVHARVRRKLAGPAVADIRVDFEDGYGARPDLEEDADAIRCAKAIAVLSERGELPPRIGLRIEPLDTPNVDRAVRTLELFVDTLVEHTGGMLASELVVTVPKVCHEAQARTVDALLDTLERRHGLANGRIRVELMVEMTQALIGPDGRCPLPALVDAVGPRVLGVHLGVYDYTAACQLSPLAQAPDHPMCDLARATMRWALGGTGVCLSDGATNVLPVGPHGGDPQLLTPAQREVNAAAVHRGWRQSFAHVTHALSQGYYQGWDMHGAQLPARYAAVYAHFVAGFDTAASRLKAVVSDLSAAQQLGEALDDAATASALFAFVARAFHCGAIDADELRFAGLRRSDLDRGSFAALARSRRGDAA